MWTLALALLQIFSVSVSQPIPPADALQEHQATAKKTWTNAELDQFLSHGFTPKVRGEKIWANADLDQLPGQELAPKSPAEKVWTNTRLEQRLAEPLVAKKPGEKVWANPALDRLRDEGLLSIIGPVEEQNIESAEAPPPYDETKDPQWYAARAAELRAELEYRRSDLQRFLLGLQNARENKYTTSGVALSEPVVGINPDSAIQFLEQRVNETQNQLDDLEDLARSNGIDPGVLREQGGASSVASPPE